MKITVFTSNQPRHLALIDTLSGFADEVFAIQECNTVFPGQVADFYKKTPVMQDYFSRVVQAEREIFGNIKFLKGNVRNLAIKSGDINLLDLKVLEPAFHSDYYVVFGSGYIKGTLCERLVERKALNIHMGVSPYFRGAATNFWAIYDGYPQYVGATIHYLTQGLDSGPMLFHALPSAAFADPYVLGMQAVKAAHLGLAEAIQSGTIRSMQPQIQDKSREIRYSRNADFTDEIAQKYLSNLPLKSDLAQAVSSRNPADFVRPFIL